MQTTPRHRVEEAQIQIDEHNLSKATDAILISKLICNTYKDIKNYTTV